MTTQQIDTERLEAFAERVSADIATADVAVLTYLGDRLGLYRALADGPATSTELAERAGLAERYVREWLGAQTAAGYVTYDARTQAFTLPPEHAAVLAEVDGPACLAGMTYITAAMWAVAPRIEMAFRSGEGVPWSEHDPRLFIGVERTFRLGYRSQLVSSWLPGLDGIVAKLERGASVLEVGCGHGAALIVMAQAFPASRFVGIDYHQPSISRAMAAAREAGVADRTTFEVATATGYDDGPFDLVCFFGCLHDLGDPVGAARHARQALADGGTLMLVEPAAGDALEDNIGPVAADFYSASTMICTPNALSQDGGQAMGAQAGEAKLREVLETAGFMKVTVAARGELQMVIEATGVQEERREA